jgi:hypothetical protein
MFTLPTKHYAVPTLLVQAVTLLSLTRNLRVSSWNVGRYTDYTEVFSGFSELLQSNRMRVSWISASWVQLRGLVWLRIGTGGEYNWGATWYKSSGSCLENRKYVRRDPSRWPRGTLYPQKLAIISPTSGGRSVGIVRSRTQTIEFSLV